MRYKVGERVTIHTPLERHNGNKGTVVKVHEKSLLPYPYEVRVDTDFTVVPFKENELSAEKSKVVLVMVAVIVILILLLWLISIWFAATETDMIARPLSDTVGRIPNDNLL